MGATTGALFFAGGCGIDVPPSTPTGQAAEEQQGEGEGSPASVDIDSSRGGGGGGVRGAGTLPDTHLLLRNCRATDVVDVLSPVQRGVDKEKRAGKGEGKGEEDKGREAREVAFTLVASDSMRWVGGFYICGPSPLIACWWGWRYA